jgi:acyl carrier protein
MPIFPLRGWLHGKASDKCSLPGTIAGVRYFPAGSDLTWLLSNQDENAIMSQATIGMPPDVMTTLLDVINELTGATVDSGISINGLRDFGIDSLGVYHVICEIEQRLGISVPDSALQNESATLEELAKGIQDLLVAVN